MERFETHTRAFIKVEDGCNRQCAYCVIPRARGPVRSRDEASILAELRQLAASGYREVVLSAISLPSYGLDTGTNLVELVEHCAQVEASSASVWAVWTRICSRRSSSPALPPWKSSARSST